MSEISLPLTQNIVSIVSVSIALISVLIGSVMQWRTITISRKNTISSIRSDIAREEVSVLRSSLAEFIHLRYKINDRGDGSYEAMAPEDVLYSKIIMLLDEENYPSQEKFKRALDKFRHMNNNMSYLDEKYELIAAAKKMFNEKYERLISG